MNSLHLHLTVQNRILIHLLDYKTFRGDFEVPFQVTQKGISRAIRIQQKHLPRALKKLLGSNYLEERMNHVSGVKQKRKVYFLTDEGIQYTWEFMNNLMTKKIPVLIGSEESGSGKEPDKMVSLEELYSKEKSDFSLLDILLFLDEKGLFNKEGLNRYIEEKKNLERPGEDKTDSDAGISVASSTPVGNVMQEMDADGSLLTRRTAHSEKLEIYKAALKQAWQDGLITRDEHDILAELQEKLGISADEHKKMELEIMSSSPGPRLESEEIYRAALKHAWVDGIISDDEDSLLRVLRRTLKITDEQHRIIEKGLKVNKNSD